MPPPSSGWSEDSDNMDLWNVGILSHTTGRHNPEHLDMNLHRRENRKSRKLTPWYKAFFRQFTLLHLFNKFKDSTEQQWLPQCSQMMSLNHTLSQSAHSLITCYFHDPWSFHINICPTSGLFRKRFPTKMFYAFLASRVWYCRPIIIHLVSNIGTVLGGGYKLWSFSWYPTTTQHNTTQHGATTQWRWRQQSTLKRWYITTLNGVTTRKTSTWILCFSLWNLCFT